jgi:hypothetical protein
MFRHHILKYIPWPLMSQSRHITRFFFNRKTGDRKYCPNETLSKFKFTNFFVSELEIVFSNTVSVQ